MQSKSVVQSQPKDLRLDFFPSLTKAKFTKSSDTKLVTSGTKTICPIPPRDTRFYLQCDC
jgi:hypothetical protein